MFWDSLVEDAQTEVLGYLAAEAASYFVCVGWRRRLLAALSGEAEEYARLVEAGLRLAFAHGEGAYYDHLVRARGQWRIHLADSWRVVPGAAPPSYEAALPTRLCSRDGKWGRDVGPRVAGTVCVPGWPQYSHCPDCTDTEHGGFNWHEFHNKVIDEGRWAPVAGFASSNMDEPPRLCLDYGILDTPTSAPAFLAAARAPVDPYTDIPELRPYFGLCPDEYWSTDSESDEDPPGMGPNRRTRLRKKLDAEDLQRIAQDAREGVGAKRRPGVTVTEDAEDAFQAGDIHELMKAVLWQESLEEDDSW